MIRLLSLLLVLSLIRPASAEGFLSALYDLFFQDSAAPAHTITAYADMEYSRPDLDQLQQLLDAVCRLAEGKDSDAILDGVFEFYDAYDRFFTASALAEIHYSADLTDKYWEAENSFCAAASPTVQQMLDTMNAALSQSPCRRKLERDFFGDGFFDAYDGEGFWSDELVALMEQESQLVSQYYTQFGKMSSFLGRLFFRTDQVAQTLVDLIVVRNQMSVCLGYDSYEALSNDLYYYRDYTPEELSDYLEGIQENLVPLYLQALWDGGEQEPCEPSQALRYVGQAAQAMGGTVWDAFQLMEEAGLYDIDAGQHKYDSSFEIYLTSYQEPFLFMNPYGTISDYLVMAHEFGHFCNDYASFGSMVGIDVSEIFSQGFEYLSLLYHPEAQSLIRYKMLDSLGTYVEQAAYARFEQEMYLLPEPTAEALCELFGQICQEYGMADEYFSPWNFITIPHFYTDPMYISSYILSNDAALQLYQLEQEQPGQGLALYQRSLDTQQPYFLAFLEEAGLESPFAPGRLEEVTETFRSVLCAA